MSTWTLADLTQQPTAEAVKLSHLRKLKNNGFPTTAWQEDDVPLATIDAFSNGLAEAYAMSAKIALGMHAATAPQAGPGWLDLHIIDRWNVRRAPAVVAQRNVVVTNSSASLFERDAGDIWLEIPGTNLLFTNASDISLAVGASATLVFSAEKPGVLYNVSATSFDVISGASGVTFTSALEPLEVAGADEESDAQYLARATAENAEPEAGSDAWYERKALKFDKSIRKVRVLRATPAPGQTTVIVGGEAGPIDPAIIAALEELFDPKPNHGGIAPSNVDVFVIGAVVQIIAISGTVSAIKSELEAAKSAFEKELLAHQVELTIGDTVIKNRIVELIMHKLTRVRKNNLDLAAPLTDTILASDAMAQFNLTNLVWTGV